MLFPVLITAPTASPVTLVEAKEHLRVDSSAEDTLIQAMINAATSQIDGFTGTLGRAVMPQTWSQEYTCFNGDLVLPLAPIQSITSVSYDGATFSDYRLLNDGRGAFLRVNDDTTWPTATGPVTVEFVAGYIVVPDAIKWALLLQIGTMYQHRETMVDRVKPSGAYEALLAPFRVINL
tara:strand:+ start:3294 stop:3827 length:534 start_codon:yes stop_codon:yes gene_type:complete